LDKEGNIKSGIIQLKKSVHIFLLFTTEGGFKECQLMVFYSRSFCFGVFFFSYFGVATNYGEKELNGNLKLLLELIDELKKRIVQDLALKHLYFASKMT
jgi:hypothetical protein